MSGCCGTLPLRFLEIHYSSGEGLTRHSAKSFWGLNKSSYKHTSDLTLTLRAGLTFLIFHWLMIVKTWNSFTFQLITSWVLFFSPLHYNPLHLYFLAILPANWTILSEIISLFFTQENQLTLSPFYLKVPLVRSTCPCSILQINVGSSISSWLHYTYHEPLSSLPPKAGFALW